MGLYFFIKYSFGFWRLYKIQKNSKGGIKHLFTFLWNYYMSVQSGYIGSDVSLYNCPSFPYGQKGIFISGEAVIGENCTIYQNVTIGSNSNKTSKHFGAPIIGNNVLIGAGAVIIGKVRIGNGCRIAANSAVFTDIPDNAYVFPSKCDIIVKSK